MDTVPRSSWILVIVLIFSAAWLAVAETAVSSANHARIKLAKDRGDSRADSALYVLDNFDRAITTLLICTNIVHIAAAGIVTISVTRMFGVGAVTASTLLMTVIVFFFGEMLPKSLAKKYANSFTLRTGSVLKALMTLLYPVSFVLSKIGNFASRLTNAGFVMTPISKVEAVDIESTPDEILEHIKNQTHSRLPVYKKDLDHIVGILQIRNFIRAYLQDRDSVDISAIMTRPLFINKDFKIDDLLEIMAEHRFTLAVVTDGKGHSLGNSDTAPRDVQHRLLWL